MTHRRLPPPAAAAGSLRIPAPAVAAVEDASSSGVPAEEPSKELLAGAGYDGVASAGVAASALQLALVVVKGGDAVAVVAAVNVQLELEEEEKVSTPAAVEGERWCRLGVEGARGWLGSGDRLVGVENIHVEVAAEDLLGSDDRLVAVVKIPMEEYRPEAESCSAAEAVPFRIPA